MFDWLCRIGIHNWKSGKNMWRGPNYAEFKYMCICCKKFK